MLGTIDPLILLDPGPVVGSIEAENACTLCSNFVT